MEDTAFWLLIVVSSVLAVFLLLASVALVMFIKLVSQLKRIAAKAETVAESVESVAESFERRANSLAVLKMITNIVDSVAKIRRRK